MTSRVPVPEGERRRTVAMVVLNYNGREHLPVLLDSLAVAKDRSRHRVRVVVLDNRSPDGDAEWMALAYPGVECVQAPSNDFLFSYNWYAKRVDDEVLLFLNNDLRVAPDFVDPLVEHLQDPSVFAASSRSFDWSGQAVSSGPAMLQFRHGLYSWYLDRGRQQTSHTLFCSGGFMAVDRLKFLSLGGFEPVYRPAYCEDLDLSFRAWLRGWRCVYEPASVVWHKESASWSGSDFGRTVPLDRRNGLLFQWLLLPGAGPLRTFPGVLWVSFGEALRLTFIWPGAYVSALRRWWMYRGRRTDTKPSCEGLKGILARISSRVPPRSVS